MDGAELGLAPPRLMTVLNDDLASPIRGSWDRDRLGQVVSNLVTNALTHGRPDTPVSIECSEHDDGVRLAVHNWGAPIPDEVLPILFEPFGRGGSRQGGQGLGLYISCEIVRAHGGSIDVDSTASTGTTFAVVLPRHTSNEAPETTT